jgi:hypothetical protein
MDENGKTVQLWLVADGRSNAFAPLRSERGSDAFLTMLGRVGGAFNWRIEQDKLHAANERLHSRNESSPVLCIPPITLCNNLLHAAATISPHPSPFLQHAAEAHPYHYMNLKPQTINVGRRRLLNLLSCSCICWAPFLLPTRLLHLHSTFTLA